MKEEYDISDLSPHLFWDVDRNKLQWEKNVYDIVYGVVEYGSLDDWIILKKVYGIKIIKDYVVKYRNLGDTTLSFLATIFKIPKENFRCYTYQQSNPSHWNS
jgi:Family of unknown function (DUF6922)